MRRGTDGDSLSGWLAFAAPLALYIATLSPGVDFWDIGEMQTVPYLLGIAHPTGFPLAILLGWAFTHALPFGDPAWRMSLLCAIAVAIAARALHAIVVTLTDDARLGVASALAFAVGGIVWTHAVRADVHDLALAAIALALAFALEAGAKRDPRLLMRSALALGAALAIHPIASLALPCAIVFAWPAIVAARPRARARAVAGGLAPLALYLYVPLRSAYVETHGGDPGRDLGLVGTAIFDNGAPSTPSTFWRYISGADFSPLHAFARAASTDGAGRTLRFAHDVAYGNEGYVMLAFALIGFCALVVRRPRVASGFASLALGSAAFVANYAAESDTARYALPALWAIGACAAVGVSWLVRALTSDAPRIAPHASSLAALALALALLPGIAGVAHDVGETTRTDDARELGREVARRTADGSLVIATWNFATPLAYEIYVAHSLGTRRIACGWPHDFAGLYPGWQARFPHIYFVLARAYDVTPFANSLYISKKWRLSELRS